MLVHDKGKYFGFQIQVHILGYGNLEEQEIKRLQVYQNPNSFHPAFYLYHHCLVR